DAGPQSFVGWASNMSAGPPDESGQTLTFNVVGNSNPALFSAQPTVDATTGTLSFTSDVDAYGVATITLNLSDNGGTANGGIDTSPDVTFDIVVIWVNDMPIARDDAVDMLEDGGPILIDVLANDYLAEEPTVIIQAGVDGFSESPPTTVLNQIGDPVTLPNGQVSIVGNQIQYEPKPDFNGVDYFTYTIRDRDGDTSTATVTVSVQWVNDPPVGVQERTFFVQENGSLVVDAETGLLAGAYDVEGALVGADGEPVGSTLTVQIESFPLLGLLTINQTSGAFQYLPPVDFTGEVEFSYRLSDGIDLSVDPAYRVRVVVLKAPEPTGPPAAGEVAIPFSLSNTPLEQSISVPPNVLVVMDTSGSMDWHMIVAGAAEDGGFELENSGVATSGLASTSFVYQWDLRTNTFPSTSDSGRIVPTQEALELAFPNNRYGVWRASNHIHNSMYYNPSVRYTPWIGQDASNQDFADANPRAVRLNPVDPTNRIDLLAPHSYRSTRVPVWGVSGGTTTINVVDLYIPRYYRTTAEPPLAWDAPHELVEIRAGSGPLDGKFPGGPDRQDCAIGDGNPLVCTYEQELQNFANFFQYYRSREYATKNGIGKVVSQLQDIRLGYETTSNTTSEPIRPMNPLYTEGNKKMFLDNVYSVSSFGGTPLRNMLGRAGQIFSCASGGGECPALPAPQGFCQQNFALLFSDGYWNGGTGITGNPDGDNNSPFDGGRYADPWPATLADVAMHYYETDLHPSLANEVPLMQRDRDGVPPGVFDDDSRMHQHMKTYAIAFGARGTIDPADVPRDPTEPFAWPDPFAGNLEKIDDLLHASVNGRGRFLSAGNPRELQAALETAFLEFTAAASSTSSAAFNSTSLREGTLLYRGFYDLRDNTGELTATNVSTDGVLDPVPLWRASERLDVKAPNTRVVVSFDPGAMTGIPFRHVSLTPEQQLTLTPQQVDFLRGGRGAEDPAGPLRERAATGGLLGDIVNSSPVFVGAPRSINRDQRPYPIGAGQLYSEFASDKAGRTPLVYVGANDGMMHGFHGVTGDELFAYVPNKLIDGTRSYRNALDAFTSPFYQHRYFVDLTPRFNDAYMRTSALGTKSWRSVLVGGLGAGGKGLFALDVTDPDAAFASEASAAGAVLWEFTDEDDTYPVDASGTPLGGVVGAILDPAGNPVKDLGYTLSLPTVAMSNVDDGGATAEKEWVALFGNGPNSTAGIAKLFVLFMDRGHNGWGPGDFVKLDTGFGVQPPPHPLAGYPNGLGAPAAVDRDLNGTVDWVYAGDRLGNLFRFDISDSNPANWTTTRLFTAGYDTGSGTTIQPILTQPLVIKHPTEQGFLVIFGTGSYMTRDDADSEDIQSIYAIWDRGASAPATAQSDSKELRLVQQTITNVVDDTVSPTVTRRIVSKNPVDYRLESSTEPGVYGWYIDLDMPRATGTLSGGTNDDTSGRNPPGAQYPGEKAIRRLLFRDGSVITTTVLPSLDEFSCFGTRPGSIILFDAVSGGDAGRPIVDFNNDGSVDSRDLVEVGGEAFSGGILFNQSDLDGQLVDLATLGGEGDTDFLFVSGGNTTVSYLIDNVNDSRTGRLSWRELDNN
ncbi:MAG: PilC/PilY family type IV pilus protein, partial [Pseudomonadales bacterium]